MSLVDRSFSKRHRLSRPFEIEAVRKRGKRIIVSPLVVYLLKTQQDCPRMAVALTRHTGTSPLRNYIKRRLREFLRHNKDLLSGLDIFIFCNRKISHTKKTEWTGIIDKLGGALVRSQKI